MNIDFTGISAWDYDRDGMSFQVIVDGAEGRCLISREALEHHYGADVDRTAEEAFSDNRWEIEAIAEALIQRGNWHGGELLIASENVR